MNFVSSFFETPLPKPVFDPNVQVKTLPNIDKLDIKEIVLPSSPSYQDVRMPWNWDTAGYPAAIALPENEQEVVKCINYCVENKLPICVSGGKHSHYSAVSDAFVLDLRKFKKCEIDPVQKTATVGPGVKLGELDKAMQPHNLAVTCGTNPDTGVIGLTLGGGVGALVTALGMTIDNILSLRVALLDGTVVVCTKDENQDLFWAFRGAGGNFGVVLEAVYQLHPLPNNSIMHVSTMVYLPVPLLPMIRLQADPLEAMIKHRDNALTIGDDWWTGMVFPAGGPFVSIYVAHDVEKGKQVMQDATSRLGYTLIHQKSAVPYHTEVQKLAAKGQVDGHWYEKSMITSALPDEALKVIWDQSRIAPTGGEIVILRMGGKMAQVAPDATSFVHRNGRFWILVLCKFTTVQGRQRAQDWCRQTFDKLAQFKIGGYQAVGAMGDSDGVAQSFFGQNRDRLVAIKKKYDPENLLSFNQNIKA
ncbi:hypothetical protein EDD86DRAFT_218554 [Gorgonomyces haynaldii]|nr:hypothetical protein EDD86DRAFT_218554 [Gorgonomyces haynaldii]